MESNKHAYATDTAVRRAADGEARPTGPGGGPFAGLGRAVVRHPWRVIALWVIAAVAVIATSPGLPTTASESSFLPGSYESIRAANLQDQAFPQAGHVTSSAADHRVRPRRRRAADRRRLGEDRRDRRDAGRQAHPRHREHHSRPAVAEPPGADGAGRHARQRGQRLGHGGRRRGQGAARRHQAADGRDRAEPRASPGRRPSSSTASSPATGPSRSSCWPRSP